MPSSIIWLAECFCNVTLTAYFPGNCKYTPLPDLIDITRVFCWKLYVTRLVKPTTAKIHSSLLVVTHDGNFWWRTEFYNCFISVRLIGLPKNFFWKRASSENIDASSSSNTNGSPAALDQQRQWRNHSVGGPRVGGRLCKPTERTREVDGE